MKLKLSVLIGFISFASLLGAVLPSQSAGAVSGTCYFTSKSGPIGSTGQCSEAGLGAYGTNDVLTGRDSKGNGNAIPSSVNTKAEFIKYLLGRFNNGGDHDQIGAAFIMQELRSSSDHTFPSASDVADWKNKMEQDSVTISRTWDTNVNATSWYDNDKKNTFYANHPQASRWVLNIYQFGKQIAQIEYACGNMVAGPISVLHWDATPTTTINKTSVAPGEPIQWQHIITNNGPDKTGTSIDWTIKKDYDGVKTDVGGASWPSGQSKNSTKTFSLQTYTPTAADVGKTFCQRLYIKPNSSEDSASVGQYSTNQCATVLTDYNLIPSVTLSSTGIVEPGSVTDVTGKVAKGGGNSPSTEWQLSKIIVGSGKAIPEVTTDNQTLPKDHFINGPANNNAWTLLGSGTSVFTNQFTDVQQLSQVAVDDLPVGTRICWALSVKPPSGTYTGWRHSAPVCLKIGKKPKIQSHGGDVRVRGSISTSTSIVERGDPKVPTLFGSWVEFGSFSVGDTNGFASGGATRTGTANLAQSQSSLLTFANKSPTPPDPGTSDFGNFASTLPNVPNIRAYFAAKNPVVGNVDVSARTLSAGDSVVIVSSGTVTIKGNITTNLPAGGINSLAQIPQMVIVAKNIVIDPGVTNIDAWLIADETINTCSTISVPGDNVDHAVNTLSASICDQPLTVNGPVSSSKLYLYRTAGSGTGDAIADPAEIFNLPPTSYLWAYQQGFGLNQPTTSAISELPPRF